MARQTPRQAFISSSSSMISQAGSSSPQEQECSTSRTNWEQWHRQPSCPRCAYRTAWAILTDVQRERVRKLQDVRWHSTDAAQFVMQPPEESARRGWWSARHAPCSVVPWQESCGFVLQGLVFLLQASAWPQRAGQRK